MNQVVPIRLCVTTMNEGIERVLSYFSQFASKDCTLHIGHQITNGYKLSDSINNEHIFYIPSKEKGLSRNRNTILETLNDGIYVVCDDDITLEKDFMATLRSAYLNNPDVDFITFKSGIDKHTERKKYSQNTFIHSSLSILKVSSIEITFDVKKIIEKNITFNESFGLGTSLPSGEENIFLRDVQKKGGKGVFIPQIVSIHPHESSGAIISLQVKKRVFIEMYGQFFGRIVYGVFLCRLAFK